MERLTKQRQLILDEMKKINFHPTAEEIYDLIRSKFPAMGMSTVYRNLETFSKMGYINKLNGHPVRYEGNPVPHDHIKCISCGKVEDMMLNLSINKELVNQMGYKLANHALEINGICQRCQQT